MKQLGAVMDLYSEGSDIRSEKGLPGLHSGGQRNMVARSHLWRGIFHIPDWRWSWFLVSVMLLPGNVPGMVILLSVPNGVSILPVTIAVNALSWAEKSATHLLA